LLVLTLSACAASRQARNVEHSGFLANYAQLMPGMGEGDSNEIFYSLEAKNKAVFKTYKKIYIDPVTIYRKSTDDKAKKEQMTPKDLKAVANNFYNMLVESLKPDYEIVREAGLNTLRLTIVITNAEKDVAVLDAVSSIWRGAFVASTLFSYAADSPGFSGDITTETRVTDATTGEILIAAVDRRLGAKNLSADLFDDWQTVNNAIAFWSKRQRYEFCKLRGAGGCVKPEA
jgi:hypothetical protein